MPYTERELSEALYKALNPEPAEIPQKVIEDRKLVESLRPVLESVSYRGSTKLSGIIEQEDQFKQIR